MPKESSWLKLSLKEVTYHSEDSEELGDEKAEKFHLNDYEVMYIVNRKKRIGYRISQDAFYRTSIQFLSGVRRQMERQRLLEKEQGIKKNP